MRVHALRAAIQGQTHWTGAKRFQSNKLVILETFPWMLLTLLRHDHPTVDEILLA